LNSPATARRANHEQKSRKSTRQVQKRDSFFQTRQQNENSDKKFFSKSHRTIVNNETGIRIIQKKSLLIKSILASHILQQAKTKLVVGKPD
jgi:hypothetical protein